MGSDTMHGPEACRIDKKRPQSGPAGDAMA
jgi:hypothetical protein